MLVFTISLPPPTAAVAINHRHPPNSPILETHQPKSHLNQQHKLDNDTAETGHIIKAAIPRNPIELYLKTLSLPQNLHCTHRIHELVITEITIQRIITIGLYFSPNSTPNHTILRKLRDITHDLGSNPDGESIREAKGQHYIDRFSKRVMWKNPRDSWN
ncbi:hypothetical protein Droror1_Dr00017836 [Drosera rotundifolia]